MQERSEKLSSETLASKFQVLMELGSGGMGRACLAMSRGPRGFVKLVVLKSLKPELLGNDNSYKMFLEEARISARLTHPNLVQTYEVIEVDRMPTMVLEYIEGQPLTVVAKALVETGRLDIYLSILTHVLAGLHAAHELCDFDGTSLNLVHRDASPHNVMVQYDGQVKVLDFGIAKTTRSTVKTQVGIVKGKLRYMAPEQLVGDEVDRRADVFSLGIMFWEAVMGAPFWHDSTDSEIMRRLLSDTVWVKAETDDVPDALVTIAQRALATTAEGRYTTAGEFHRELCEYLAQTGKLRTVDQIGNFMQEHFAKEREATSKVIQSHIQAVEESLRPPATQLRTRRDSAEATAVANRHQSPRDYLRRRSVLVGGMSGIAAIVLGAIVVRTVVSPSASQSEPEKASQTASVLDCGSNSKSCSGQCVQFEQPEYGCAAKSCFPCDVANATPRCNQRGACDIAVCYQAYDNCDGDVSNGCETNVRIDPDHCGSCQHRCPELPHAMRGCGDACTIWRCEPGYRDCDGEVADGCETQVNTDTRNCGHCGVRCPANSQCKNGRCT